MEPDIPASLLHVIKKAMRFCAYTERCTRDVTLKIDQWGVKEPDKQKYILSFLKKEGMIDDERFAINFAHSKLRHNKWGPVKIDYALKNKRVDRKLIDKALDNIPPEEFSKVLQKLAGQKLEKGKGKSEAEKVRRFLLQRGFENDHIRQVLNKMGVDI